MRDELTRQNLEALREAAGLDTFFIAQFDAQKQSIEQGHWFAAVCSPRFNPEVFIGSRSSACRTCAIASSTFASLEIRDTSQPRRDLAAEAALFASLQVGAVLLGRIRHRAVASAASSRCARRGRAKAGTPICT